MRAWILATPLGEVEADESVVGLMAIHVLQGEFPSFYWGQPYLGSLEGYLVAGAFALLGPSNLVLKLVPGFVFGAFAVLVYVTARRLAGGGVARFCALYLALPPSFLALWSLKARGGYVELLALGQAVVVLTPWAAQPGPGAAARFGLLGVVAGALLWTHPLGLVYVVPAALYLVLALRTRLVGLPLTAGLLGFLLGAAPLVAYNLSPERETLAAVSAGSSSGQVFQENLGHLAQVGLPVMLGLGQATSSPIMFVEDWPRRIGSRPWLPPLLLAGLVLALLPWLRSLAAPLRRAPDTRASTAFLLLGVLVLTPILAALGRLGESVAEPRYALPLYSTLPLFVAGGLAIGRRPRWLPGLAAGLAIGLNIYSLATADPRLNLPTTAAGSTAANRAELLSALESAGATEVYTDYWLAYPLTFESGERITASVSSGGYNRFAPYAHYVAVSESPAFVFIAGSAEHAAFLWRLSEASGASRRSHVSIYEIHTAVQPLERLRP